MQFDTDIIRQRFVLSLNLLLFIVRPGRGVVGQNQLPDVGRVCDLQGMGRRTVAKMGEMGLRYSNYVQNGLTVVKLLTETKDIDDEQQNFRRD